MEKDEGRLTPPSLTISRHEAETTFIRAAACSGGRCVMKINGVHGERAIIHRVRSLFRKRYEVRAALTESSHRYSKLNFPTRLLLLSPLQVLGIPRQFCR